MCCWCFDEAEEGDEILRWSESEMKAKNKEIIRYKDLMLSLQVDVIILLWSFKPNG